MADLSFGDQIKNWRNKTEQRIELVFQESIQDLAKEANEPRAEGGNMPVITGFLRNSLAAAINSIPTGESTPPEGFISADWNPTEIVVVVNQAKIGDRVTLGYTANYAPYMEARYSFVRLAAQNWPQIVKRVTRRVDRRIAKANLRAKANELFGE